LFHSFEKTKIDQVSDIFDRRIKLNGSLVWKRVAYLATRMRNSINKIKCGRRVNFQFGCRDCLPLHAVSQVNKTKNTNGMILGAYTEQLNLFQICEMLESQTTVTSIFYACSLSMHGRVCWLNVTFTFVQISGLIQPSYSQDV
jgi:hypothetical protein